MSDVPLDSSSIKNAKHNMKVCSPLHFKYIFQQDFEREGSNCA